MAGLEAEPPGPGPELPSVMAELFPRLIAFELVTATLPPSLTVTVTVLAPGPCPTRVVCVPLQVTAVPAARVPEALHGARTGAGKPRRAVSPPLRRTTAARARL